MELNKTELVKVLDAINKDLEGMTDLQYIERDGHQYIIEMNEMFAYGDYFTLMFERKINEHLLPNYFIEPEITNAYLICRNF